MERGRTPGGGAGLGAGLRSKLFQGRVEHRRLAPVEHAFRYPVYTFSFDLAELPELERRFPWFGYNRPRPVSIHDRDYLRDGSEPLLEKLLGLLAERGLGGGVARVELVTSARLFGYVFNPVSFFHCFGEGGELRCVVAEVNNTFGERHVYVLEGAGGGAGEAGPGRGFMARYRVPKAFYVSPFNEVEGEYDFLLADLEDRLEIHMRVLREGRSFFWSAWKGRRLPLDTANLLRVWKAQPLDAWKTMLRIHWQAALLYFQKRLPITVKPRPDHPDTLRAVPPTPLHTLCMGILRRFLGRMEVGCMRWVLPDGQVWQLGQPGGSPSATLVVNNYDFFLRLVKDGDVALGEGFSAREYDCEDLTAMLKVFIANREALDDRRIPWTHLGRWWNRLLHLTRANTLGGSRRNISAHYDLGNELFRRFLDPTMTYSCALFLRPEDDLEAAQRHKYRALIERARLTAADHVLEIGCGWGGFALEAARSVGCRVTGITLSTEQLAWARRRVEEEGLGHLIELRLQDYRQVEGRFSRIVSIEMIEAVGHEHLGSFFAACERLLAPDGLVALQVITTPDWSFETYRRSCDWIQKVIFPGSLCPSLTALSQAMAARSRLMIESLDNLGPHYARTLSEWRRRFRERWGELEGLGYDERFRRTWEYYFAYCEAGFATRILGDLQLVLTRPSNRSLPDVPLS